MLLLNNVEKYIMKKLIALFEENVQTPMFMPNPNRLNPYQYLPNPGVHDKQVKIPTAKGNKIRF